jgi:hypothetical protein
MTHEKRRILQMLDEIVRSERVRSHLEPIVERVRRELAQKTEALMTWEPVPLTVFRDALPAEIRSGWIFVLRAGTDTGAERHPNSHQRMMTFAGTGDMKIDAMGTPDDVESESEIAWRSHVLVSDSNAPFEKRWISIPQNIWHRPVIPKGDDWVVVSFHTVPAEELIEERPGAKQMIYAAPN